MVQRGVFGSATGDYSGAEAFRCDSDRLRGKLTTDLHGDCSSFGAGLITDLPARLVTTEAEFAARVTDDSKSGNWYFTRNAATRDAIATFNAHLRGYGYTDEFTHAQMARYPRREHSPAVDAGDPASKAYENEPAPNGHRVNMGAYGRTPYATKSVSGLTIIIR